jgi:predicted transcriptional regulator
MEKISFNFVPVPVSILKALFKNTFSATENKILMMILYQTYAFDDKPRGTHRQMSLSYIANGCNVKTTNICKYLQRLEDRNVIISKKENACNCWKINPDTEKWKKLEETNVLLNFPKEYRNKLKDFKKWIKDFSLENNKIPTPSDVETAIDNYFEDIDIKECQFEKIDFSKMINEIQKELTDE